MSSKYLFFLLIPALFICVSCTSEKPQIEEFLNFSTEKKQEIKKVEKKQEEKASEKQDLPTSAPIPVKTEIEGETIIKRYNVGYLTFNVADFYAELTPLQKTADYTKYRFRLYSKTNGFVDYVFGWMSYTVSELRVYNNKVVPENFKTKVTLKKKTREIVIDYDTNGKIVFEQVTPPDNRGKRPAVEDKFKIGSFDPLTIVIETRRLVMNAVKNNNFNDKGVYSFTLPLYDGRKRTDINFELRNKKVSGLYPLKFVMKDVAGYTNNELEDAKKGDKIIEIFIDPKTFTPVTASGKSPLGSARARLLQDCEYLIEDCVKLNSAANKK